jgi:hypothetical protein
MCPEQHGKLEYKFIHLSKIRLFEGFKTNIPIYIQQDATLHSLFISGNCSTCFEWYLHPSSGAHTTVFTASDICHTVIATYCYSGRKQ